MRLEETTEVLKDTVSVLAEAKRKKDKKKDKKKSKKKGKRGHKKTSKTEELIQHLAQPLDETAKEKIEQLKSKYMEKGHFKGKAGTGTRFDNCVKYFENRGDVADPKAMCAKIARAKDMVAGSR